MDGIFTQSNYGIVTKMGFWLMPEPAAFKPFAVKYDNDEDIEDLVEMFRPLSISGIIPNGVVFVGTLWEASPTVRRSDYTTQKGATPKEIIQRIRDEHQIGAWTAYGALYGIQEQVDVNWKIATDTIKAAGKGTIVTEEEAGDNIAFTYRADLMRGNMTLVEFGLYNWRGGGGSMWFAPVSQAKGSETRKQVELAPQILNKHGLDYVGEFIVAQRAINKALKRALDPNNILAPGKSGIDLGA